MHRERRGRSGRFCSPCLLLSWSLPCFLASSFVDGFAPFPKSSNGGHRRTRHVVFQDTMRIPSLSGQPQKNTETKPDLLVQNAFFKNFSPTVKSTTPPAVKTREMSMTEMIAMNAAGGALTVGIVYALASSNLNGVLTGGAVTEDSLEIIPNIIDAAVPLSATDIVTISFSEAVAAICAAGISLLYSSVMQLTQRKKDRDNVSAFTAVEKAVGNGDFLLAQATAKPLLASLGLPPFLAATLSALFASVPAEAVRIASRRNRERRDAEDKFFDSLLRQEQEAKRRKKSVFSFLSTNQAGESSSEGTETSMLVEQTSRNRDESILVEIARDVIKWLGYSVLCADLSGQLTYNGLSLFPGVESAFFGIIAALSAQVYGDILYCYFGFGGEEKAEQIRSRNALSWAASYASEAAYSGIFFGFYEFAQIPAKASVSAFLSGGADACYGSQDFDVCLETFKSQNPPGASAEAEFRSLVTTLVSLWNRYTPDTLSLP